MFQFLHAADIHLDSPLLGLERYEGAPVERIRGATRRALERLVALALEEKVAFVLIAGDLYDGDWRDVNTGLFFVDQMRKLREAEIPVYVIAGNHDAANRMTKTLRLPENVHFFLSDRPETKHLPDVDVAIHGQSFAKAAITEDLSSSYPAAEPNCFNIGMLHTCATGSDAHARYAPCTVEGLESRGYDYWALGHIHKREILCRHPHILFPGNVQGRHIRESGPKGCTLVTVDQREVTHWKHRSVDVMRWETCSVDIADWTDPHELLEETSERFRQLLDAAEGRALAVRIRVVGAGPVHAKLISRPGYWTDQIRSTALDVSGGEVWIEKIAFRTSAARTADAERSREGPLGELATIIVALKQEDGQLENLAGSLEPLLTQLKKDVREQGSLPLDNPSELLRDLLPSVETTLWDRLLNEGEAE
ncbi:putative metallophosphoesterase YhaO [Planctomycetes bacterium Pan216]|uniref:Putative metallophosphoesterase YhaO n=1 Tax=Kolteria novifilia TaxID=2527975 RepID=A0A518B8V7_9BACT|nr:putative metallophosphoesterase YhaO [Planctomycetes bacterium Pan216]